MTNCVCDLMPSSCSLCFLIFVFSLIVRPFGVVSVVVAAIHSNNVNLAKLIIFPCLVIALCQIVEAIE